MNEAEWRIKGAWRGAMVAVLLSLFGMPIDMLIGRQISRMPLWPNLMSMAVAAVLAGILLARRRAATARLANGVFLVNMLVILAALWLTNAAYAGSGRDWVPFQANKLGMMTIALLAPQLWVGLVSIGAFAAAATTQLVTFADAAVAGWRWESPGRPWASGPSRRSCWSTASGATHSSGRWSACRPRRLPC